MKRIYKSDSISIVFSQAVFHTPINTLIKQQYTAKQNIKNKNKTEKAFVKKE